MKKLHIDTANNAEISVGLKIDGKEDVLRQALDSRKSQVILPMIRELLDRHKLTLRDLTAIEVNPGPGSFTGLRVGVSIANALGFYLRIPVNGKEVGHLVEPRYT